MNLELSARPAENHLVVALQGQLDAIDAAPAIAAVSALRGPGQCIILDLAALEFIDCHALRALVQLRELAQLAGGDVLLAAPRDPVQRLLTLTRLDLRFCVHHTVAAALAHG